MSEKKQQKETSKGDNFTSKIPTNIWMEDANPNNQYLAEKQYLYGYDFEQVIDQLSYTETLFLMLTGSRLSPEKSALLELIMKFFITPGVRHPATRAAMNAGIGRTHVAHILPISLAVHSADYLGCKEVGASMKWITENKNKTSLQVLKNLNNTETNCEPNPFPGFGTVYNGIDEYVLKLVERISKLNLDLPVIEWTNCWLNDAKNNGYLISWLPTGVAAAVFIELGIDHRTGVCLFQFLQSPGLIAHGVEKSNKPLTDMPFIPESDYVIQK